MQIKNIKSTRNNRKLNENQKNKFVQRTHVLWAFSEENPYFRFQKWENQRKMLHNCSIVLPGSAYHLPIRLHTASFVLLYHYFHHLRALGALSLSSSPLKLSSSFTSAVVVISKMFHIRHSLAEHECQCINAAHSQSHFRMQWKTNIINLLYLRGIYLIYQQACGSFYTLSCFVFACSLRSQLAIQSREF